MTRIFESSMFNFRTVKRLAERGSLLVAQPGLSEGWFRHGVITLINHDRNTGSMGVVMNNRLPLTLQSLIENITRKEDIDVYCGGPVNGDQLFFMHTLGDLLPGAFEVSPGLYVSGDFDIMKNYVNSGYPLEGHIRFFVGYSGWEAGQLDRECLDDVWAVTPTPFTPEQALTGTDDAYWHKTVRAMGASYATWLRHPKNPSLN